MSFPSKIKKADQASTIVEDIMLRYEDGSSPNFLTWKDLIATESILQFQDTGRLILLGKHYEEPVVTAPAADAFELANDPHMELLSMHTKLLYVLELKL